MASLDSLDKIWMNISQLKVSALEEAEEVHYHAISKLSSCYFKKCRLPGRRGGGEEGGGGGGGGGAVPP